MLSPKSNLGPTRTIRSIGSFSPSAKSRGCVSSPATASSSITRLPGAPRRVDSSARPAHCSRMADQPQEITELSFEAALKRLEEIVRRLESGEAPLDESIELYGEGDRLRQQCEKRLQAAQAKIEKIQLVRDGQPSGTAPFDGE